MLNIRSPFVWVMAVMLVVSTLPFGAIAVDFSMRDTTFSAYDTLRISIDADSIAEPQNVLSYQFILLFDPSVVVGVGGEADSTITEPFGDPFTSGDTYPGELRMAAAGIQPVYGTGRFVTAWLRAASPQGGVSVVRFGEALLNEGDPSVFYADTLATLTVSPLAASDPRSVSGSAPEILLSPNPARDHVLIQLPLSHRYGQISLWNIVGQRLEVFSSDERRIDIDVSRLPSGMYIFTFEHKPKWSSRLLICR